MAGRLSKKLEAVAGKILGASNKSQKKAALDEMRGVLNDSIKLGDSESAIIAAQILKTGERDIDKNTMIALRNSADELIKGTNKISTNTAIAIFSMGQLGIKGLSAESTADMLTYSRSLGQDEVYQTYMKDLKSKPGGLEKAFDHVIDKTVNAKYRIAHATTLAEIMEEAPASTRRLLESKLKNAYDDARGNDERALGLVARYYAENNGISSGDPAVKSFYSAIKENSEYKMDHQTGVSDQRLFDKNMKNFQLMVFYPDDDGMTSYCNMVKQYDRAGWEVEDKGNYAKISKQGVGGREVTLYANKPFSEITTAQAFRLNPDNDKAVAKLYAEVRESELSNKKTLREINKDFKDASDKGNFDFDIVYHRGHTEHTAKTLRFVDKHNDLVFIGSCESEMFVDKFEKKASKAHTVSVALGGTAGMNVNDPVSIMMNESMLAGRGVNWTEIESQAKREIKSPYLKEYIFPSKSAESSIQRAYQKIKSWFGSIENEHSQPAEEASLGSQLARSGVSQPQDHENVTPPGNNFTDNVNDRTV